MVERGLRGHFLSGQTHALSHKTKQLKEVTNPTATATDHLN